MVSSSKFHTDDPQISGATLHYVCIFFADLAPGICPSLSGGRGREGGHSLNNPVIRLVGHDFALDYLKPNELYMRRTAPLTSRRCILYIYSTNIRTEYFKHAVHSFFLFKMPFIS
jgi:hypothetical protein